MEFLLYLLGNWIVGSGGIMLLYAAEKGTLFKRSVWDPNTEARRELLVSYDLQVMLFIGAIARCYWSFSPPTVYHGEVTFVQWLSIFDILSSPLLWAIVLIRVGLKQKKYTAAETPTHFRWPAICGASLVLGFFWSYMLPPVDIPGSFWFQDVTVMFNMIGEGLAMVPQMHLTQASKESATKEASHFVGMLCLGRVFRVLFWVSIVVGQWFRGQNWMDPHIWSFIIPDMMHSVIMGDYLFIWLRKVKRDQMKMWGVGVDV